MSFNVTPGELMEMALEALRRSNALFTESGHPEDIVASLCPAMEAVAVGFGEGYRRGREASNARSE